MKFVRLYMCKSKKYIMKGKIIMKKLITFLLTAALLAPAAAFAEEPIAGEEGIMPISDNVEDKAHAEYVRVEATIASIKEADGVTDIEATAANEEPVNFTFGEDIVIIAESGESTELKEGVKITAYTKWNKPMTMELPVHYRPDVIVLDTDDGIFTDADRYTADGEFYTNAAKSLSINVKESEIVNEDGTKFDGDIDGRDLLVFYGASTRSIPAQTNPSVVVVLAAEEDNAPADDEEVKLPEDWETVDFDGVAMLPVRTIAESLGYEVAWDNTLQAVTVGTVQMGVNFKVGENSYNKSKMTPFVLESAPVLVETDKGGVTYVPVSFFTDVLGVDAGE